ncbi:MAG: TesB-like acyl-CoA thioesterase 3 [Nocardioidaceae bacterium]|nr:TesB-like acyl-CoA thioesterase 3 [Nocardioidaceae bacterium]
METHTEFDRATQVEALPDGTGYAADVGAGWGIGGGVNGGYLLALIGRAAAEVGRPAGHPDPFVVTAHYVTATRPGPAVIRTRLVRSGRSLTTVAATLEQDQDGSVVPRVSAQASCGDLSALTDDVRTTAQEPDLPPREECFSTDMAPEGTGPGGSRALLERFDMRMDPACVGWALGKPSGRGMLQAWFRLNDDRDLDPVALLLAVDSLPPVTFDLGQPGWAPTLELSVHVRARPAPGWVKLRQSTRNVAGGYFEEDCEVWDSAGRLVAQSRQLAMLPR